MLPPGLKGKALLAAQEFADAFPDAVFTSGKRTREAQARAMASNIFMNRSWIAQVYRESPPSKACHKWVMEHPEARTVQQLADGLLSILNTFTDDELSRLTLHLSGDAFDVQYVKGVKGGQMIAMLYELANKYGGTFLEWEGGRRILHFQVRS